MKFNNEELDKETINRLMSHSIFISRDAPPVNKEKALVLIGEAMLDKFVKEFVSLWKDELFPNCLLRDHEASEKEMYETIHPQEPWPENRARQDEKAGPAALCSNDCKEVIKMDQNMQAKLDAYLELFQELKQKTSDERTALTLLQEVSKDKRMEQIRNEREANNNNPATEKQRQFMKRLGIDFPENTTKQEASALIDEELGKNSE